MKPILIASLLAAAAAACAPPPGPPGSMAAAGAPGHMRGDKQCFHAGNVNGFNDVGPDTIDLTVGSKERWRVEVFGLCDVDDAIQVAVQSRAGSSWICDANDAELIVPMPGFGPRRCSVKSLRRLTAAEIEAERRR